MSRIVTKGVGLMQRKVEMINLEDEPEAFMPGGKLEKWFSEQRTADQWRDANAEHVRESLERAAAKRGLHVKQFVATLGEDQAYWIFWEWLCVYNRLARERAKPEPDIALIVMHAEDLARFTNGSIGAPVLTRTLASGVRRWRCKPERTGWRSPVTATAAGRAPMPSATMRPSRGARWRGRWRRHRRSGAHGLRRESSRS